MKVAKNEFRPGQERVEKDTLVPPLHSPSYLIGTRDDVRPIRRIQVRHKKGARLSRQCCC